MLAPVKMVLSVIGLATMLAGGLSVGAVASPSVDGTLLDAVLAYGQANLDQSTGLVRDSVGEPNLAEHSPGYLSALLAKGGHEAEAKALLAAILDNQDTDEGSASYGHFRWHGGTSSPYSYDATLYAVPPLAWVLRHFRAQLGGDAERLGEALRLATEAISRDLAGPENESYLMLQAAARASAGVVLDQPTWVSGALGQVQSWLKLVKSHGLPQGHSPTFDALRIAALLWVGYSIGQQPVELQEAIRLARADAGMRIWAPGNRLAGAMYRSFPADYMRGGGVATYALAGYFGHGTLHGAEPFAMYLLLPSGEAAEIPPRPELPYQFDTRSPDSSAVTTTSTFMAPEFTLGTMSGFLSSGSVPLVIGVSGSNAGGLIYAWTQPAAARLNSVQSSGTSLLSFDFDRIGLGSRRQAYVTLMLGNSSEMERVYVRGAQWNAEATGLGYQETLAAATGDCYVGVLVGRCGPAQATGETRVKPGHLNWAGQGVLKRLVLTIHGRQADYDLERPLQDVRVVFAVHVAAKSEYASLSDFAAAFGRSRIRQDVEATRRAIEQPGAQSQRRPVEGVVPTPQPKTRTPYRHMLEHTVELRYPQGTLKFVEDLRGGEMLDLFVDDKQVTPEYLWSAPGFEYCPGGDLSAALSEAGY